MSNRWHSPPSLLSPVSQPLFLEMRRVWPESFRSFFFNIYTLLSPVCIFITKFYIAVDPLVSAQRCLDHPELLFLSNQYCSIA